MIDFVNLFKTVATAKNLEFLYGRLDYIELKLNDSMLNKSDGLLYVLPVSIIENVNQGIKSHNIYSTTIGLCRQANLENYYDEHYHLQLKEMGGLLVDYVRLFSGCSSSITLLAAKYDYEINKFSENCDVVLCEIQFSDE